MIAALRLGPMKGRSGFHFCKNPGDWIRGQRGESKIKVLVLYCNSHFLPYRNTVDEHLYSFRRYVGHVHFHYHNALNGVPRYLTWPRYDGVILHYTFLAQRWSPGFYRGWKKKIRNLRKIKGYKVAIPQDENAETNKLCELFRENDVKTVFTCFTPADYQKAYPVAQTRLEHYVSVFPGYVDEKAVEELTPLLRVDEERPIDLGYRARKVPYWLGRHGQIKYEIGEVFRRRCVGEDLKVDISSDSRDFFYGKRWYEFLCRCRAILGCEGGASLLDHDGKVREKVEKYVEEHPGAPFDEVESACFPDRDYDISLFALSPRHFEAAITKTCQVLVEGDYGGIFQPNVHYIELRKDFSNLNSIIKKLNDKMYCKVIAEAAYRDVIESGKYTYRVFANRVVGHMIRHAVPNAEEARLERFCFLLIGWYLRIMERIDPAWVFVINVKNMMSLRNAFRFLHEKNKKTTLLRALRLMRD